MSVIKKILNIALYILLTVLLGIQVLAMAGVLVSDVDRLQNSILLIPIWIGAILLLAVAFILYKRNQNSEKRFLTSAILSLTGTLLALVVALTLGAALPEQAAATNINSSGVQGLNGWKLFSRHYSIVFVGTILSAVGFVRHALLRSARIQQENASYEERFDFDADAPVPAANKSKKKA